MSLILAFSPIFVRLKLNCLVTLFDRKLQVLKKSPNIPFMQFSINLNVEGEFFVIFKHYDILMRLKIQMIIHKEFWCYRIQKLCSEWMLKSVHNFWDDGQFPSSFLHASPLVPL